MAWTAPADPDRGLGALWGLALGDALGTTLEGTRPTPAGFDKPVQGVDDLVGGGPYRLPPGGVTDDTQMAACVAQSLLVCDGDLDVVDLAARFLDWSTHAFTIGSQIHAVLRRIGTGSALDDAARAVWIERERNAAGNGGLMRAAPLAVAYCTRPDALIDAALTEAGLTHWDPRCRLAQAAYDAAIAAAVAPGDRHGPAAMIAAARAALDEAAARLDATGDDRDRITAAHSALSSDLDAAEADDPGLYGAALHLHKQMGFVRVGFRLGFWQLVHAPDYRTGVVDVANRGGDADTNAAIAGALLGARFGASSLPAAWIERVRDCLPTDEALATRYHPSALVELCS